MNNIWMNRKNVWIQNRQKRVYTIFRYTQIANKVWWDMVEVKPDQTSAGRFARSYSNQYNAITKVLGPWRMKGVWYSNVTMLGQCYPDCWTAERHNQGMFEDFSTYR